MSDKDNFDSESDDAFYDDALDENFEFEDDYEDVDLGAELEDSDSEAVYDEGFEDDWENEEDVEPLSVSEKKSKLGLNFNTMVIIGAVAVGGFIMMSQVKKEQAKIEEKKGATTEIIPTALKMEGVFDGPGAIKKKKDDIAATSVDSKEEKEGDDDFFFNVDVLDKSDDLINDVPPMPSPITSGQDSEKVVEVTNVEKAARPMEEEKSTDIVFTQEAKESVSSSQEVAPNNSDPADIDFVQEVEEVTSTQEETVIIASDFEQNEPILVADAQVAEDVPAEKNISQPSPVPTEEVVVGSPGTLSLNEKLDNIINRLGAMETRIEGIEKSNNDRIDTIVLDIESLKAQKISSSQAATSVPVKKVALQSKVSPPKEIKKKPPKKLVQKVIWELRAAQPGKAWVSKKGQKNMRPIVVGDELVGIGRIRNISYRNNRWVVQGSAGRITQ